MREIKFRAWDKTESEWIDIKYLRFEFNDFWYLQEQDEYENEIDPPYFSGDEDFELMQYTGLKDKNGVDIYEGDVVEYAGKRYLVEWEDYMFNLKGFYEPYLDIPYSAFSEELEFEVVGNAYEHPHLLEVSE